MHSKFWSFLCFDRLLQLSSVSKVNIVQKLQTVCPLQAVFFLACDQSGQSWAGKMGPSGIANPNTGSLHFAHARCRRCNKYILLAVLVCSTAEYFNELCRILTSPYEFGYRSFIKHTPRAAYFLFVMLKKLACFYSYNSGGFDWRSREKHSTSFRVFSLHFFRAAAASCVLYNRTEPSQGFSIC